MLKWTNPLPTKPSALIRVALADLEKVEKSPAYEVNMNTWHLPRYSWNGDMVETCRVCLAGAVLACNSNLKIFEEYRPPDFSMAFNAPLFALDSFRSGDILKGLRELGIVGHAAIRHSWHVTPYENDPVAFKRDMQNMAGYLEQHGY